VRVSTPEAAALTKLLENIFRSVNIALVNELAMLTDRIGIDIWEVIDAASTKPYGFMRFEPGPDMGGHCPPVDPFYLSRRARELDMSLGVRDTRESPALKTLTLLQGLGAELRCPGTRTCPCCATMACRASPSTRRSRTPTSP
jgi:UDP-N-acetyl-D-mannosaminuronate dehydrogenase